MTREMVGTCSTSSCKNGISAQNKSGVCTGCQQGRGPNWQKPRDVDVAADDAVLDRVEKSSRKPRAKTPPTTVETEASPPDWQRQFFSLAEALGLNPVEMLEEHCRDWVEQTRARALAKAEPAGE